MPILEPPHKTKIFLSIETPYPQTSWKSGETRPVILERCFTNPASAKIVEAYWRKLGCKVTHS